jgi:transcriptional regulator GlxA family with amidase domain
MHKVTVIPAREPSRDLFSANSGRFTMSFRRRPGVRRLALVSAYLAVAVLLPLLLGAVNLIPKLSAGDTLTPPPSLSSLPPTRAVDPTKRTAVVLTSAYGAEITDFLPTYEILALSGAFNVYAVAPERAVVPLMNVNLQPTSLDFLPDLSYAEYERMVGAPPDLIVIPNFGAYTAERDAVVLDWLRNHNGPRTTILAICTGTMILADTGLLAGRTATTNTTRFAILEQRVPSARWLRNVRYVDDGNIVTSSNLASGIDATLHVVDRYAGRAVAGTVAQRIGYTGTRALDDTAFAAPEPSSYVNPILANAAFAAGPRSLGVLLYEGVSEIGLAAAIDPYASALLAHSYAVAAERTFIRTRNDLVLLPRYDAATAPALERVIVPAGTSSTLRRAAVESWSGRRPGTDVVDLFQAPDASQSAYEATFADIARENGAAVAALAQRALFYASASSPASEASWPAAAILTPIATGLLGILVLTLLRRRRAPRPVSTDERVNVAA